MTDTSERIRQAAARLFAERGYAATSIGDIEKAAGLAPRAGTFYRHFRSKQALLQELALERISETPDEFGFDRLKDLGDTRAELISIAQVYERAGERQLPYLRLIGEVRHSALGSRFEHKANADMLSALAGWVAQKPYAHGLGERALAALTMSIFGGWLFYLTKVQQGIRLEELDRDILLDRWASFWAETLDRPARPGEWR